MVERERQSSRIYTIRRVALVEQVEAKSGSDPAGPLFTDVTNRLSHRHVNLPAEDFFRQLLLLFWLGHGGTGLAWCDFYGGQNEEFWQPVGLKVREALSSLRMVRGLGVDD
ncbi:MAG: hypothetical protein M2R46_00383 [Verrucomicrobia subdivision 3 bacterium]|nr:hypothetical protein [Limisphaerales bacterium]